MTALSDLLNSLNREKWSSREIENRADRAGQKVSYAAVSRYLNGNHPVKPSAQVLAAFAAVFGTDVNRLRAAAGQGPVSDRFELPAEADMLDPDERRAVVNLVRVMARRKAEDNDRQGDTQQGPEARSTVDGSEDRRKDGSTTGRRQTPMSELEKRREQRRQDERDSLNFGTPSKPGDLDQGKLQPPPARNKSAAYEPDEELEGPAEARKSKKRGEESQNDGPE